MILIATSANCQAIHRSPLLFPRISPAHTTGDYLPFSWLPPGRPISEVQGADIELAKSLAESLGVACEFVHTTWPTLLDDLKAGRYDIAMCGIARKPARAAVGMLSAPYLCFGKTPVVRVEDRDRLNTLEKINQPSVTAVRTFPRLFPHSLTASRVSSVASPASPRALCGPQIPAPSLSVVLKFLFRNANCYDHRPQARDWPCRHLLGTLAHSQRA